MQGAMEVTDGGPATLAGDASCDTPGHSAKYGSYTLMHVDGRAERPQPHRRHGTRVRGEPTNKCITYSV